MKTLKFSKNSWHYYIASKLGGLSTWEETSDFCTYVRAVLLGTFFGTLLFFIGGVVVFGLGHTLGWVAHLIFKGWVAPSEIANVVIVILIVIAIICVIFGISIFAANRSRAKEIERWKAINEGTYEPPQPGFIASAYKSFKNKTCFKVELN